MKKIISILTVSLLASVAFAITDSQKAKFSAIIANPLGSSPEETVAIAASNASTIKPIADWALESPQEFREWAKSVGKARAGWLLTGYFYNLGGKTFTLAQDFAITGGSQTQDKIINNRDIVAYTNLKESNFTSEGVRMEDARILKTAAAFDDLETINTLPKEVIAEHFDKYLTVVENAAANMDDADVWTLWKSVSKKFTSFKSKNKEVEAQWKRVLSNEDDARLRAK